MTAIRLGPPPKQGLYDPQFEHDACGVGFVVNIKGKKSNSVVKQGIQILKNLDHRGACGSEVNTGDGAGILMQLPHAFLKKVAKKDARINLPEPGLYAAGNIFMPRNATQRRKIEEVFARVVQAEGQIYLGARTVPTNNTMLGETAKASEPFVRQVFIGRGPDTLDENEFERKLYVIRKRAYNEIRLSTIGGAEFWYVVSLSHKTMVYKGMLTTMQLDQYFLDLQNPLMESAIALVHSRFSTNTFPSWDRAHPYRCIAHNGEINTLRGNINWMRAREALFQSPVFGEDISKIPPIVNPNGSDSSMFDNVLELMVLSGRSMPHAVMMMIPEPWSKHASMDPARRAFYQYHSSLMEPWDGPADISFTDGKRIGAVLDRNGLRPGRYYVTKDDICVMASEAGVLDFPPEHIVRKGRLQPGRMFLVDTELGRIVEDEEIKQQIISERPYAEWLKQHLVHLKDLPRRARVAVAGAGGAGQAPGVVRLHLRRPAHSHGADGARWQRRRGLHGQRHAAGGAVAEVAHAVRLLQAVVRAGHEPAHRLHPRGDHHLERRVAGFGRQPARSATRRLPAPGAARPGAHQRRVRQGAAHVAARAQGGHVAHPVPRRARRGRAGRGHRTHTRRSAPPHRRGRGQRPHPLRSRREQGVRGHPVAAGRVGAASLPDPPGTAHEVLAGAGDRRRARGASLRAAHRLWLQRDQSVPGLRNPRRHDPRRDAARRGAQAGLQEFREGRGQGRREGDVEDGHLGRAELPRRAGVRGRGPAPGRHRRVFHRHRFAGRRRRARRDRARSAHAPHGRVRRAQAAVADRAALGRPVPVACGRRVPPVQPGEHPSPAEGGAHRLVQYLQELRRADRRPREESIYPARPARLQAGRADSDRRSRIRREHHEAASRPAP